MTTSIRPIHGQPGLFQSARRTAMAGIPDEPTDWVWDVPRGRPWTLGSTTSSRVASLQAQFQANDSFYEQLKTASSGLLSRYVFDVNSYEAIARSIAGTSGSVLVRLTAAQFAQLTRAALSVISQGQALAQGIIYSASPSEAQLTRASKLLAANKRTAVQFSNILNAIQGGQSRASSAISLNAFVIDDAAAIFAGVIAATVIVVVGSALVYSFLSTVQANRTAIDEASRACELDEAQGNPCSGTQWQTYVSTAQRHQQDFGTVPNLNSLLESGSSLLFWGGLLAVAGVLGYAAWTAEPARRTLQTKMASQFAGVRRRR